MTTDNKPTEDAPSGDQEAAHLAARRDFLAKCGKLAVITPPVVTLMLTAASRQAAASGFGDPGGRRHGHHHHHHHHHRDSDHDGDR